MSRHNILMLCIALLTIAFLDPFMILMPMGMIYTVLGAVLAGTLFYALAIMREDARDEREVMLRASADRVAGLVGTTLLVLIIAYQVLFLHNVDTEIVIVLLAMMVAKQFAYSRMD